jgi:uncharacterized BrkB/YihY/UPF0761 family membrane protein
LSEVTGVTTAGRLSLSSGVRQHRDSRTQKQTKGNIMYPVSPRRSHWRALIISFGIIAVGIVGVVISGLLDAFLPHSDPKFGPGFIPGMLSLAVIALGLLCSLLSGIWCLLAVLLERRSQ